MNQRIRMQHLILASFVTLTLFPSIAQAKSIFDLARYGHADLLAEKLTIGSNPNHADDQGRTLIFGDSRQPGGSD